jgi:hypothetical protein
MYRKGKNGLSAAMCYESCIHSFKSALSRLWNRILCWTTWAKKKLKFQKASFNFFHFAYSIVALPKENKPGKASYFIRDEKNVLYVPQSVFAEMCKICSK